MHDFIILKQKCTLAYVLFKTIRNFNDYYFSRYFCLITFGIFGSMPSQHLLGQSQQWKHENNVQSLFKVNNKVVLGGFSNFQTLMAMYLYGCIK